MSPALTNSAIMNVIPHYLLSTHAGVSLGYILGVVLLKYREDKWSTIQVKAKLLPKCSNSLHSHQQNKRCHDPSLQIFGMVRISSLLKPHFFFFFFESNHCSAFDSLPDNEILMEIQAETDSLSVVSSSPL